MPQSEAVLEPKRVVPIEHSALRVVIVYILIAATWIWLSDRAILWFVEDARWASLLQTYKGWFFVAMTAALLYAERAHNERRVRRAQNQLQARVLERSSQLERIREEMQIILDNAPVQVFIRDVEGRYVLVNRHWENFAGIDRDAALGTTPKEIFDGALAEAFMQLDREVLEQNKALIREKTVHWNGATYAYISAKFPLREQDGTPYAVGTILTDITDRKQAAEQLESTVAERTLELRRAYEQLLLREHDLAEAQRIAHVGDWRVDLTTNRMEWSDEVLRIFGVARADFDGTLDDFLRRIHPDDRARVDQVREEARSNRSSFQYEHRIVLPDGSIRHVYERGYIVRDESGNPIRIFGTVQDVTEQKLAEAEIRKLNAELETRVAQRTAHLEREIAEREKAQNRILQLNRMLDRQAKVLAAINKELETFSYSVSHDLKAPIRGIDGYSRLLLDDYHDRLDEEGRFFLASIRKGAAQMTQLIDDLLAYSRLDRRQLKAKPVELRLVLDALIERMRDEVLGSPFAVSVDIPDTSIHIDPDGFMLVLRNLIENAIKFSSTVAEPRIEVSGRQMQNSVLLWVRDNGVGFDMQYHDRIFEVFQRLHRAEEFPGTGVGLAIVRRAIERMGGRVWAESAPNAGATFFVELPLQQSEVVEVTGIAEVAGDGE